MLVLLLAVLAGGAGWWFGMGRYTTTPAVINLGATQAQDKVELAGLTFEIGSREFSETVAAGAVIRTDPEPGSDILEGGTVTAVLSKGPERYEVPALRGRTLDKATAALERANLEVGRVRERFHEKVAAGVVLASSPGPGEELKRGSFVDLVVSKGREPIEVPDFTGKSLEKAEKELAKLELDVQVSRDYSDSVDEGDVISQEPSSGTLFRGDTVQLVVSDGPELVEVPRVQGAGVAEATERLEAAGFEVRTEHSDVYVGLEFVVKSDPPQGSLAPRGSTVTLFLV